MSESSESELNTPSKVAIAVCALVLAGVLIFILFGIQKEVNMPQTVEYNYFTFQNISSSWQTEIVIDSQRFIADFRFNPYETEGVYVSGEFSGFKKSPVYITFDPDVSSDEFKYLALANSELALHLVRALNVSIEAACTKNLTDACIDRPIITCDSNESVIYLVSKAPAQITLKASCVTITGHEFDLVKSVDRFLFQWYKIQR